MIRTHHGQEVIEDGALPFEIALSDVEAEELLSLNAEAIVENWDPYKIPARNLVYLAFSMGVLLWDDDWSEEIKRKWLAEQWRFKALRGTLAGIQMALDTYGYKIVQVVTPPQYLFATRNLTKDEWQAYIARLPQLRVYLANEKGKVAGQTIAGRSFVGRSFARPDFGPSLYGRRSTLVRNGVETSVRVTHTEVTQGSLSGQTSESFHVPGKAGAAIFATKKPIKGKRRFVEGFAKKAEIYSGIVNRQYNFQTSEIRQSIIRPNLEPIDIQSEFISLKGKAGKTAFAGHAFAGKRFATRDAGAEMLLDLLILNDPDVVGPVTRTRSFAGHGRVGMPPCRAEMVIRIPVKIPRKAAIAGRAFAGRRFAVAPDLSAVHKARKAILASKSLRDKILITFQLTRRRSFADTIPLDGSYDFHNSVRNYL